MFISKVALSDDVGVGEVEEEEPLPCTHAAHSLAFS